MSSIKSVGLYLRWFPANDLFDFLWIPYLDYTRDFAHILESIDLCLGQCFLSKQAR